MRFQNFYKKLLVGFSLLSLFLLTFFLTVPSSVFAHAGYDKSNPPANASLPAGKMPERIQVWFTEKLEPRFSELSVVDKNGQRVDKADSKVQPDIPNSMVVSLKTGLPDGPYTVIFSNVSAEDGHTVKGSFAFLVGAGELPLSATNSPLALAEQPGQSGNDNLNFFSVVLRWLNYLGGAGVVGALLFTLLVWERTNQRAKATGRMGPQIDSAHLWGIKRAQLVTGVSLGMLLVGWVGWWFYQAASFSSQTILQALGIGASAGAPGFSALSDFLFSTRYGNIWFIRLGLIALAGAFWVVAISGTKKINSLSPTTTTENDTPEATESENKTARQAAQAGLDFFAQRRLWWGLTTGAGAAILLTTSLNSHAAGVENWAWLAVGGDWLHLLSTAVWVGGLLTMGLALLAAIPALLPGTGDRTRLLAALIPTFSQVAILSVMILVITGALNAALHLGDVTELLSTSYGLSLTIKVGLLVPLLLLAAYNLLVVSPQMRAFAKSKKAGPKEGAGSVAAGTLGSNFRRSVWAEVGLTVIILLATAFLTSSAPPNSLGNSNVFYKQFEQNNVKVDFAISPANVGDNSFEVRLTDKNTGSPIADARLVDVRLQHLGMDMGNPRLELKAVSAKPGHYLGQAPLVSMAGDWEVTLLIQRNGQDDLRLPVQIKVK